MSRVGSASRSAVTDCGGVESVVFAYVTVGAVEELLILVELVLKQRLAQRLLDLPLAGQWVVCQPVERTRRTISSMSATNARP